MERNFAVVLLVVMSLGAFGCAGQAYYHDGPRGIIQGGRTGVFGADTGWVYIPPAVPADQPEKIKLEKTYTKTTDSWEKKGGGDCPKQQAKRNIRHEKIDETVTEEVLNPAAQPTQAHFGFVGGPSTGNLAIPALIEGGLGVATGAVLPDGGDDNSVISVGSFSESGAAAGAEANAGAEATAGETKARGHSHQRGNSCAGGGCR